MGKLTPGKRKSSVRLADSESPSTLSSCVGNAKVWYTLASQIVVH